MLARRQGDAFPRPLDQHQAREAAHPAGDDQTMASTERVAPSGGSHQSYFQAHHLPEERAILRTEKITQVRLPPG